MSNIPPEIPPSASVPPVPPAPSMPTTSPTAPVAGYAPPTAPLAPKKGGGGKWVFWGCGGCLALFVVAAIAGVAIFFAAMSAVKSSDAYKTAMAGAEGSPEVQEAIGTPLKVVFATGSVKTTNGDEEAALVIPVKGSKDSGTIIFQGSRPAGGAWKVGNYSLTVNTTKQVIDLSSTLPGGGQESTPQESK